MAQRKITLKKIDENEYDCSYVQYASMALMFFLAATLLYSENASVPIESFSNINVHGIPFKLQKVNESTMDRNITYKIKSLSKQTSYNHSNISPKWSKCFKNISNPNIYSNTQYLLQKLENDLLITNKLKIFVPTYMRMPNIYESKCGIPIISYQISHNYYYIENEFYFRNIKHSLCEPKPEFCLPYDWTFLWHYVQKHYSSLEWLLILEDDISFCPNVLNNIFYYTNDTLNTKYEMVLLGAGFTGMLVKFDLLGQMIKKMWGYPKKMNKLYRRSKGTWWKSPDTYLQIRIPHLRINYSSIYHPSGTKKDSTLNHPWDEIYCGKHLGFSGNFSS